MGDVAEWDDFRVLEMFFLHTIEEEVKFPTQLKVNVSTDEMEIIQNYVSAMDLDEDFEDEKNDYRDKLLRGFDIKMEHFSNIIQSLGVGEEPQPKEYPIFERASFFEPNLASDLQ